MKFNIKWYNGIVEEVQVNEYSNYGLALKACQSTAHKGHTNNGNMYYHTEYSKDKSGTIRELRVIYSYGNHFPVAVMNHKKKIAYVNVDKYSPSTTRHTSTVEGALRDSGYKIHNVKITYHKAYDHRNLKWWIDYQTELGNPVKFYPIGLDKFNNDLYPALQELANM